MNSYEKLQDEACKDGIDVIDYTFHSDRIKGLYCDGTVAIRKDMNTAQKTCTLAEEQNILYNLKFDKLDKSIEDIKMLLRNILKLPERETRVLPVHLQSL